MEFRLFGPVEIVGGRGAVDVGAPKQRVVLASLLLSRCRPVPVDVLTDQLWGEALPTAARDSLYTYIARLRRSLEQAALGDDDKPVRLVRRTGGYLIDADPETVDVHRFRRLVDEARRARAVADDDRAVRLLREALALCRGVPVAGLPGAWAARIRDGLRQQQVAVMAQLGEVELKRGRHAEIVTDLASWVAEHPIAEPLAAHLMLALYRSGRGAEALTVHDRTRRHIVETLGNDPGPELQRLHQRILRQDSSLAPPAGADTAAVRAGDARASPVPRRPPSAATPAQLPADIATFTGRTEHLRRLDALLPSLEKGASTLVISAIGGAAGVGKTALAVHWAHRVADRFPDGQLYVNLRGFDPGGSATSPAEALRGFLDAFEVLPQRIPAALPERAALYRSTLAGRRVLVVLDNARDADQVRPLLPGAPGCLAVVTSRNQLSGLVAAEGAHPLNLDLLTTAEARQMLAGRFGPVRTGSDPTAVDEIINRCARLPLALAIVAARAATHPDFPLATLADELRDTQGRLNALSGDDATTDVWTVFSWSYRTLSPAAGRLFRLLGLHPGPDLTAPAAASLVGSPVPEVRPLLAELTRGQMIREHAPGRYSFHDLLRAYATELTHRHDPDSDRRTALRRVLDHYLRTADAAGLLLNPHRHPIALARAEAGVTPEGLADHTQAMAWFTNRYQVLLAAVETAADNQLDTYTWQLTWALSTFFQRSGRWQDWIACGRLALDAARRLDDRVGQAYAHRGLGMAYGYLSQHEDAHPHLQRAADLFGELGDANAEAHAHMGQGWVYSRQGRYQEALNHSERALELNRVGGDRRGQAFALNNIGWYHAQLGDHAQTLNHCQQALTTLKEIGDRRSEANTWDSLGYAHHQLGHHEQATRCYHHALDLHQEFGHRYDQAEILVHLGDNHHAAGDADGAGRAWREALDILDELGHPTADEVRTRLG